MANFTTMAEADVELKRLSGLGTPAAGLQANADGTFTVLMPSDIVAPTQAELDELAYQATVPQIVSMAQARKALSHAGLLATVEAAIAAMTGQAGDDARIDWSTANEVWRSGSLVQNMGAALGLTARQVDALFIAAAAIKP